MDPEEYYAGDPVDAAVKAGREAFFKHACWREAIRAARPFMGVKPAICGNHIHGGAYGLAPCMMTGEHLFHCDAEGATWRNLSAHPKPEREQNVPEHCCCICGPLLRDGVCPSCRHARCDKCPPYVPQPTLQEQIDRIGAALRKNGIELGEYNAK